MTLRKVTKVGEAFRPFVEEVEQQRRPWLFTSTVKKSGFDPNQPRDEIGRWTDAGRTRPGKVGRKLESLRRRAAAKLMGKAKKVSRYKWKFPNGMIVETYPVGSEQFKPPGWRDRRILAKIRLPGEEISVMATRRYEGGQQKEITAKDRDAFMEKVILPTLAEIPPSHLEDLRYIEFDAIEGPSVPGGRYHGGEETWSRIEINGWHRFREYDNWESQQGSLKHEIAHHVWDKKLTDAEKVAYARRLGVDADPKALTFIPARYDKRAIRKVMGMELEVSVTPYGRTNVFEDFADWYKGWNEVRGTADKGRVGEAYWDEFLELDMTPERKRAFEERRMWLPADLFER